MRYTDAKCRLCRREGQKLYLKGARCLSPKCPITKRGTQPGMHGKNRPKLTEYGKQLREKQKAKKIYGINEAQCKNYYKLASKAQRANIEFASLVERRADNVVYKAGFAVSRAQARQMVSHGLFTLNGRRINIPSILIGKNSVLAADESKKDISLFKQDLLDGNVPGWLEVDKKSFKISCIRKPESQDVSDLGFDAQAIVEFYSR